MPNLPMDLTKDGVLSDDAGKLDILPAAKAGGFWDQQALLLVAV